MVLVQNAQQSSLHVCHIRIWPLLGADGWGAGTRNRVDIGYAGCTSLLVEQHVDWLWGRDCRLLFLYVQVDAGWLQKLMHIANPVCDMPGQDKYRGSKSVSDMLPLCVIDDLQYKFIENQ